jgi:membrane-anchored mycosin MYCP
VDAVAALTFNVPPGDRLAPGAQSRVIVPAAPPLPPDHRARTVALVFAGLVIAALLIASLVARARRER